MKPCIGIVIVETREAWSHILSEWKEMEKETLMARHYKYVDNHKWSRRVSRAVFLEKMALNWHEDLGERHIEMTQPTFQLSGDLHSSEQNILLLPTISSGYDNLIAKKVVKNMNWRETFHGFAS